MPNEATSETKSSAMTVLIFLAEKDLSDLGKLEGLLQKTFTDMEFPLNGPSTGAKFPYLFKTEGVLCTMMHMEAPAPLRSSDPEIRNAVLWPNAWDDIRKHQAHLVISVAGGNSPYNRAIVLQRIVGAVFEVEPSAIGTAYPYSGALLSKRAVGAALTSYEHVCAPLFISCFFAREPPGTVSDTGISVSTKGLSEFGLMDVEARHFTGSVHELHQFIFCLGGYLIEERPNIRDGDTIGLSAEQKIQVKFERSMYYPHIVYRLYFPH